MKVLKPKEYRYIKELMMLVFHKRATTEGTIDRRIGLIQEDPRRIARNIAPIPPPSVQSLVDAHKSRFK